MDRVLDRAVPDIENVLYMYYIYIFLFLFIKLLPVVELSFCHLQICSLQIELYQICVIGFK